MTALSIDPRLSFCLTRQQEIRADHEYYFPFNSLCCYAR